MDALAAGLSPLEIADIIAHWLRLMLLRAIAERN
jgi:hypothetical protein